MRQLLLKNRALFSRTISLYVASAGADTHVERSHLLRTTFYYLRERAHKLGFNVNFYDLRAGVPALNLEERLEAEALFSTLQESFELSDSRRSLFQKLGMNTIPYNLSFAGVSG